MYSKGTWTRCCNRSDPACMQQRPSNFKPMPYLKTESIIMFMNTVWWYSYYCYWFSRTQSWRGCTWHSRPPCLVLTNKIQKWKWSKLEVKLERVPGWAYECISLQTPGETWFTARSSTRASRSLAGVTRRDGTVIVQMNITVITHANLKMQQRNVARNNAMSWLHWLRRSKRQKSTRWEEYNHSTEVFQVYSKGRRTDRISR